MLYLFSYIILKIDLHVYTYVLLQNKGKIKAFPMFSWAKLYFTRTGKGPVFLKGLVKL